MASLHAGQDPGPPCSVELGAHLGQWYRIARAVSAEQLLELLDAAVQGRDAPAADVGDVEQALEDRRPCLDAPDRLPWLVRTFE